MKLKLSIFINIYMQDYEVVNLTWQLKSRWRHCFHRGGDRPAKPQKFRTPANADENGRLDSSSSQLVPPPRSTWERWKFQQLLAWANDRFRKTEKPSRTSTQWRRLIVAFRRSPAKKAISEERQPTDDRSSRRSRRTDNFEEADDFINW